MTNKFSIFNFQFLSNISNFKLKTKNSPARRGFTLIELLVVVSIIGILVSLLFASFTIVQQQARNTQRKNDLKQYQTALENYAAANNSLYPATSGGMGANRASTVLCQKLTQFIAGCLEDPRWESGEIVEYRYESDKRESVAPSPSATSWVLKGKLEGGTRFWIVCSNGKTGEKEPVAPATTVSIAGGNCPL